MAVDVADIQLAAPRIETGAPRAAWLTAGLYLAAGFFQAAAWGHPDLAWFGWLSVALVAVAIDRTRHAVAAFAGMFLVGFLSRAIGLPHLAELCRVALGLEGANAELAALGACVVSAFPVAALVGASFALSRLARGRLTFLRRPWWLPLAWMFGEHVNFEIVGWANEAWLMSQWTVGPVLRALGHLGWWPTLGLSLLAAVSLGLTVAHRRPGFALPAVWLPIMTILPALPSVGLDRLEGIAAVHVRDDLTLPDGPPPGESPEIVLWPEDVRHLRPLLMEGQTPGALVRPMLPGSHATQLVGLLTESPLGGTQNQLVAVAPGGAVRVSRAKRHLMAAAERAFLGVGADLYVPGRRSMAIEVAGRPVAGVICGELMHRGLVEEGVRDGGEALVIAARDLAMTTPRARRHLLAVQVMRSVEFGVPSVRSSLGGAASFVGSDGRVLAESRPGENGLLFWDRVRGARDVPFRATPPASPDIAVLYSKTAPRYRTPCPEGRCTYHALEDFTCADARASTVIVAGHGRAPEWLSHRPSEIARAVRCFGPELVVIDTCLGASDAMLEALVDLDVIVVAASRLVPAGGLVYGAAFFADAPPEARAAAVHLEHGALLRWRTDRDALEGALARAPSMPRDEVAARLVRRYPEQIAVPLAESGSMLVTVDRSEPTERLAADHSAPTRTPPPSRRRAKSLRAHLDSARTPATNLESVRLQ